MNKSLDAFRVSTKTDASVRNLANRDLSERKLELQSVISNPWALKLLPSGVHLSGDGEMILTAAGPQLLNAGSVTSEIAELMQVPLHEARCTGRSVMCITNQNPYFAYLAQTRGATKVTVVDPSNAFISMLDDISEHLAIPAFNKLKTAALLDVTERADIVIVIFSELQKQICGSPDIKEVRSESDCTIDLARAVAHLGSITSYMVILKWTEVASTPLSYDVQKAQFEKELNLHFKRVKCIGTSGDGVFYLAFKLPFEIDLRCPMPALALDLEVVNCKLLTKLDGLDYWSRVYRAPDRILKQTSFDLAFREYSLLRALTPDYFPKPISYEDFGDYGVVAMEKIEGHQLSQCQDLITADEKKFSMLVWDCLQILSRLQRAGISHRDISEANILMRGEKPLLIDFSWGVTSARPMFTPDGLKPLNRDAHVSDVVSMGFMLKRLANGRYTAYDVLFDLMVETNCDLRVHSGTDLQSIFALLTADRAEINTKPGLEETLLKNVVACKFRMDEEKVSRGVALEQVRTESRHQMVLLELEHQKLHVEFARVLAEFNRVEAEKNFFVDVAQEREEHLTNILRSKSWRLAYSMQMCKARILKFFKGA